MKRSVSILQKHGLDAPVLTDQMRFRLQSDVDFVIEHKDIKN